MSIYRARASRVRFFTRRWWRCTLCRHRWVQRPEIDVFGWAWETCSRCDWTRPVRQGTRSGSVGSGEQ